jgi:hypothetical protein
MRLLAPDSAIASDLTRSLGQRVNALGVSMLDAITPEEMPVVVRAVIAP